MCSTQAEESEGRSRAGRHSRYPGLDPQCLAALDVIERWPQHPLGSVDLPSARLLEARWAELDIPVQRIAAIESRLVGAQAVAVRIYRPSLRPGLPVVVFAHGGGWVFGNLDLNSRRCRALANAGDCIVADVAYRLAPEHPFPAALRDVEEVLIWIAEGGIPGADHGRIAVAGESAGGNLAAAAALLARDTGGPRLRHQLLLCPALAPKEWTASDGVFYDGLGLDRADLDWSWKQYLGDPINGANPYASPLLASELSGLPPAFILTAEFDPLRDEGESFARRLQEAGVPTRLEQWDGTIHIFLALGAVVDAAPAAIARCGAVLREAFQVAGP